MVPPEIAIIDDDGGPRKIALSALFFSYGLNAHLPGLLLLLFPGRAADPQLFQVHSVLLLGFIVVVFVLFSTQCPWGQNSASHTSRLLKTSLICIVLSGP